MPYLCLYWPRLMLPSTEREQLGVRGGVQLRKGREYDGDALYISLPLLFNFVYGINLLLRKINKYYTVSTVSRRSFFSVHIYLNMKACGILHLKVDCLVRFRHFGKRIKRW